MSPLFGASRSDREHVLVTLRSLGPTTAAGVAAALSWSTRRTDKAIREIMRRREAALDYDPRDGTLAFAVPHGHRPNPAPVVAGSIPEGGLTASLPPTVPVAASSTSTPAVARPVGPAGNCDYCGVRMAPTGTGTTLYCPECGRLATASTRRTGPPPTVPVVPATAPPLTATVHPPVHHPPPADDRRAQELFAAWVTSQPIPCPRCRTPLRHRGVGDYGCPACGERVQFGRPKMPNEAPKPVAIPAQ